MEKEKTEAKEKKGGNKKTIIICVIAVLIIVAIVLCVLIFKKNSSENAVGNNIGNIRNYGYVTEDDKYLYFMAPNDDGTALGIRKISKDDLTGDSEMLIEGDWQLVGLNYMDGYLYFITMTSSDSESDDIDNKIHRMKVDGSEDTIINDNEFNNDCYEIYVVKDKLYYIGTDECIYKMDLDGSNKIKMNDEKSGFIGITEDYIFYNKKLEIDESTATVDDLVNLDYETWVMNLDGSNAHVISEGKKLYSINVVGDYIYYETENGYPSKIKIDGTEDTMLSSETAYNMIVTEDGIFYFNYYKVDGTTAGIAVYRMDLDGSNVKELAKLDSYSEMLCEFGDWLYFSDSDTEKGRFKIVSKDGRQVVVLYDLDLSKISTDETTSDTNTTADDSIITTEENYITSDEAITTDENATDTTETSSDATTDTTTADE